MLSLTDFFQAKTITFKKYIFICMHLEWHMSKYNFQEVIKRNSYKYKISWCQRVIHLIKERTSQTVKMVQRRNEEQGLFSHGRKNGWMGLDSEPVNILQSNKAITFGVIFSTWQKSLASLSGKNLQINMQLHRKWVFKQ